MWWHHCLPLCLHGSQITYKNQESELLSRKWWRLRVPMKCERGSRKFKWFFIRFSFLSVSWKPTHRCLKSVRYLAGKLVNSFHSEKVISPNFSSTFLWVVRGSQGSIPHLNPQHSSSCPSYRAEEEGVTPFVRQCVDINVLKSQRKRLLCLT